MIYLIKNVKPVLMYFEIKGISNTNRKREKETEVYTNILIIFKIYI